ncbi:YihY/virulence factor BrkB family protein [Gillisia sp. M10.2A]|uniref:YihY/virulence factor BrkB family protein n=1 Tax=Gillisia lutea TaxID=2909668 RepID=A0ABS9EFP7_9FLAO|nr:YihY/virulence factor BrkB family protein [Gillisia lutea]MCF4101710.1 YihY/virulence factor BrkB family protein [Gillisia lutea]
MRGLKTFYDLLKQSYFSWSKNDPFAQSAIIAYYTLFSLPSLLIIVVSIAGYFFGVEAVQGRITNQIQEFIGREAAMAIEDMIGNAALHSNSTLTVVFGGAMLLFGATGVFFQLKKAMNNIWNVTVKKETFLRMVIDRVISFGMILVIGLLLLVALIISAVMRFFTDFIESSAPVLTSLGIDLVNYVLSFVFITLLFASIFKLLPDIRIRWKVTLLGAALTTVLFLVGEFLISFYFGKSDPASVYGGASSVVLILLWVNYTCLIMFYGAEFTVQYALHKNEHITPNRFGEPAIYQEMEKLQEKKVKLEKDKKILDHLSDKDRSNKASSD